MGNQDTKIQDSQNEPISHLLGGLKRVEAPSDFDFRVKARIAKGKPTDSSASWLPDSVRYAVPLLLLLLVGGYVAFNAFYPLDNIGVPVVAEVQTFNNTPLADPPSNDGVVQPSNQLLSESIDVKAPESRNNIVTKEPKKRIPSPDSKSDRPGGGSFDEAIRKSRQILPRGFDPNVKPANVKGFDSKIQLNIKDLLEIMGIKGAFTQSGWKVESVTANNMADRSGVKTGDVIEAVNDKALTEKTSFGNKFTIKSLGVRRDGQSVKIDLKP